MEDPLGIDRIPYFSWVIVSDATDVMQTAYRIVVSDLNEIVWDSGRVKDEQSTFIVYDGVELRSRTRYFWTATVWDNQGNVAEGSSWFETAFLSEADWVSEWAVSPLPFEERFINFGNQPPATMFRKFFTLAGGCGDGHFVDTDHGHSTNNDHGHSTNNDHGHSTNNDRGHFTDNDSIVRARLYVTCHGIYRLTINGQRPDDREFAPEHTSYEKYLCYQTYDVTGLLHSGENVIGMYVGDGWYCGPLTMVRGNDDTRHAVLFQLEVTYSSGESELICSGADVTTAYGPVLFSDLYAGEMYDANLEVDGWDTAGFDDKNWVPAVVEDYGYLNLVAQSGPPVRPVELIPAVKVYTSPKGEKIVDFGQNLAGRVRMKVSAPKGTEITLDHFEAPDCDGNYFSNIYVPPMAPLCEQRVVYVSNGKPGVYEALFTYHGFRYVRVSGLDVVDAGDVSTEDVPTLDVFAEDILSTDVSAEDFIAVVLSSDLERIGTFECSDQRLNRLYENTRRSQRSNMLSIPTDCPQREKAGWTNDAHVYAATAILNDDMTAFYTSWLRNLALSQAPDGRVPIAVPYTNYYTFTEFTNKVEKGMLGLAGFGDSAVIVPYMMYQMTGNHLILREQYESMKGWCDYVISASARPGRDDLPPETEKYLWNTGLRYGEWMIPSFFKEGYKNKENIQRVFETSLYTGPIFAWYSLTLMAKTAALLGKDDDAVYYAGVAGKIKDAFAVGIINEYGTMPFHLMGAYVMPLYYDLVPEQHKQIFAKKLVEIIKENNGCLDTGFMATPLLLDTLCMIGRAELAYEILYQENCPSWLYQISKNATTVWESFHCYGDDGNPLAMSMNHYASGSVCDWMFRYIGGIESGNIEHSGIERGIIELSDIESGGIEHSGIERGEPGFKHIIVHPRPDPSLTYAKRSFMSEYGEIICNWERKDDSFILNVTIPCNTTATVILPCGKTHNIGSGSYVFTSK